MRQEEEIIVRIEADQENCGFVVSTLEDRDSGKAPKRFEEDSKEIGIENYEMKEDETSNDNTKRETKTAKRRCLKSNSLTAVDLTCQYCGKV